MNEQIALVQAAVARATTYALGMQAENQYCQSCGSLQSIEW